jgi:hypothetical protein
MGPSRSLSLPNNTKKNSDQPAAPGVVPEGYTTISEGSAKILQRGNEVFYNPVQVRRGSEGNTQAAARAAASAGGAT